MSSMQKDYGLEGCRMRIIRVLGSKLTKNPLSFRQICRILYAFKDEIMFDVKREWKSQADFSRNYWKSTEILENLETLVECGLANKVEGRYVLTELGKRAYEEVSGGTEPKEKEAKL